MRVPPTTSSDKYTTPNKNPRLTLNPTPTKKVMHETFEEMLRTQKRILGG